MVSPPPRFSVVVPTRGRPAHAEAVVRAVLAQENAPAFELVLADQSESPPTLTGDARLHHLHVEGRGRSLALNAGCAAARGIWIVVTDDDCRPARDWLAAIAAEVDRAPALSVIVGRVVAGERAPGAGEPPAILDEPEPREIRGLVNRDWIYPNLAFPRRALGEIGSFDERLGIGTPIPGGEDNDWGYRLLSAGWTILYRPAPVVVHEAWRSIEERAALKRAYGCGQGGFYAKHLFHGDAFIAWRLTTDVFRQARGVAGSLLAGRTLDARGHLAYARGLVAGMIRMAMGPRS